MNFLVDAQLPRRLLLIPTLPAIIDSLLSNRYVELTRKALIIHG